jgi:hypothetical protein
MIRTIVAASAALVAAAASVTVATAPASADPGVFCGTTSAGSVYAGPNTSCPFAMNTANNYQGNGTISVYSPVTGGNYLMNCNFGVCTGGNGAVVFIR